ncbi:MAG: glycosyltransferase [Candidatus Omnitrophica bacterium]|nr:glycosyltransferase [Candidatus Omnitrophota bacterium]
MKIGFIEPHLKIHGGIRRIIELSNHLVKRGHEVNIFHSDGASCKWMECRAKIKPYNAVLSETHDAIIYNDPNPIDFRLTERAEAKLKVYYVLGLYEQNLLTGINLKIYLPRNQRALLIKKSLQSSYLKLANSTWLHDWLKDNLNISSEILLGGVNTQFFRPVEIEKNKNEIRILCSGGERVHEGMQTIVEAIKLVKKEESKIVLDTYHNKGIPQEEMAAKYSSADIFVDARWHGGWNNPVAEAMACKVPVICSDIGSVADFAFDERTALLVPVKDSKSMASAIIRLIQNKHLREKLTNNAYKHIQQFSWQKSAECFEKIIEKKIMHKNSFREKLVNCIHNPKNISKKIKSIMLRNAKAKKFDKYEQQGAYHWRLYKTDVIYTKHVDFLIGNFSQMLRGTLLDVGCGDGLISCQLASIGFKVMGIDLEKEAIKLAKQKCSHVEFDKKDLYAEKQLFDYVLASEIIEHLEEPENFLKKLKRLFKKAAVITTPRRDYYRQIDYYHFREYSKFEFESLLGKFFNKVRIFETEQHLYAIIELEVTND